MVVNVLDPELPFLASQAAVELDLILNGATSDISAVKQLAERLNSTLIVTGHSSTQRSLSADDSAMVAVLGQAWNQSRDSHHVTDVSEVGTRTAEIAEQLATVVPGHQVAGLELMRAYCLALSRCASSYRKSIFEIQRPHPYRR